MNRLLVCVLLSASAFAQCDGKLRSMSGNFPADLKGTVDTRSQCWGLAESTLRVVTFNPPPTCAVEIVKLRGDLVAWPLGESPAGTAAGVLVAVGKVKTGAVAKNQNLDPKADRNVRKEASVYADWADDDTLLYLQHALDKSPVRLGFSEEIVDGTLNSNNQLLFTLADWLNTTGLTIHMEVTWTAHYRFVDKDIK